VNETQKASSHLGLTNMVRCFTRQKKESEANSGRLENGLQTDLASGTLSGGEEIK